MTDDTRRKEEQMSVRDLTATDRVLYSVMVSAWQAGWRDRAHSFSSDANAYSWAETEVGRVLAAHPHLDAAPKMLAALEDMVRAFRTSQGASDHHTSMAVVKADAAIAKARGRTDD